MLGKGNLGCSEHWGGTYIPTATSSQHYKRVETVLCSPAWPWAGYIAEDGLELTPHSLSSTSKYGITGSCYHTQVPPPHTTFFSSSFSFPPPLPSLPSLPSPHPSPLLSVRAQTHLKAIRLLQYQCMMSSVNVHLYGSIGCGCSGASRVVLTDGSLGYFPLLS